MLIEKTNLLQRQRIQKRRRIVRGLAESSGIVGTRGALVVAFVAAVSAVVVCGQRAAQLDGIVGGVGDLRDFFFVAVVAGGVAVEEV